MKRELLTLLGNKYQEITRADISVAMAHPAADSQVWVLVEGQLDVYHYGKVFNSSKTQIRKVLLGNGDPDSVKKAVQTIVKQQTDNGYRNIIGITDKDYEHFVGTNVVIGNVFETDCRDLEISLLNESCVRTTMATEIPHFHTDYTTSLPVARFYGYLHITADYLSKPFNLNINSLGWSHICNGQTSVADYEQYMLSVLNGKLVNRGYSAITMSDINSVVSTLQLNSQPDNIICHGHALVKMLSLLSGHTNVYDPDHLEHLFADACPAQTSLGWDCFQQIKQWQEKPENGYYILSHEENFEDLLDSF